MQTLQPRNHSRRGYAMLVALILMAVLTVIGATSLNVAGVDQRIAIHTRRHMTVMNAADAGGTHSRYQLMHEQPLNEGWDTGDAATRFVPSTDANTWFEGVGVAANQGTYDVDATYDKCSLPPVGYSTESGTGFRSDYWDMASHSWFEDSSTAAQTTAHESTVVVTLRKVMHGPCKIR